MIETNLIEDLRRLTPPDTRLWMVAVVAAMAVLATLGIWRWARRRPAHAPPASQTATDAAWETALAELERLASLLRPEASREYCMAATSVLRRYIEQRYGLCAPRLATEEFLGVASRSPGLPSGHRQSLGRFLVECDLCKFGRYTATTEELGRLHAAAVEFVLASRPAIREGAAEGPRA